VTLYPRQLSQEEINYYRKSELYTEPMPRPEPLSRPEITFKQAYLPVVQMVGAAVFRIAAAFLFLWWVR
jgi:hypothetical protein